MKRAAAAMDETEDTGKGAQQNVRIVSASSAPRPETRAPSSIFAAGQAAKPARQQRAPMLDPLAVVIRDAVPIPPRRAGAAGESPYGALFARMAEGQMVELATQQANGFASWAKKYAEGQLVRRALAPGVVGCWKVAKPAEKGPAS